MLQRPIISKCFESCIGGDCGGLFGLHMEGSVGTKNDETREPRMMTVGLGAKDRMVGGVVGCLR